MSCSLLTVLGSASGTCQTWVLHKQSPCLTRLVTDPNTFKRLQLTAKQTIDRMKDAESLKPPCTVAAGFVETALCLPKLSKSQPGIQHDPVTRPLMKSISSGNHQPVSQYTMPRAV